ncbi:hypothetical protein WT70_20890 [Burkholderia stagnalis]|nr:hypothetical protein WT70_20890 [Burkholderia stagnalis]
MGIMKMDECFSMQPSHGLSVSFITAWRSLAAMIRVALIYSSGTMDRYLTKMSFRKISFGG